MNDDHQKNWQGGILVPLVLVGCGVFCIATGLIPSLRKIGRLTEVSGTQKILIAIAFFLYAIGTHIRNFYDFKSRIFIVRTMAIIAIVLIVLSFVVGA
ncbi:MAG: hypothetical protein DHS20C16_32220 [Phycisphaerae bacterium]|nr:MAG: hypothetical protein DHS20C16_32220 [Phycisphaerae bacterium]